MNKPVAYITMSGLSYQQTGFNDRPLYTHPVKDKPHPKCDEACMYLCRMRELTDEEIIELWKQFENNETPIRNFAKAILRKAQEK